METINTPSEKEIISNRKGCVFLIDDNPVYLGILEEEVQRLLPNVTIFPFESGEQALEKITLRPFLVFLDYDLAGGSTKIMNGIKILKEIKKQNSESEVVMLSGVNDANIITTTMKHGAFDFIVKSERAIEDVKHRITAILRKLRVKDERNDESKAMTYMKWAAALLGVTVIVELYLYMNKL